MSRRRSTWVAQKTTIRGITFDSKHEAKRYCDLCLLQHAGKISNLRLQPKFKLGTDDNPVVIRSARYPNGRRVTYTADFEYLDTDSGLLVWEDAKGRDTDASRLRRAFTEWQYKIRIDLI